MNTQNRSKNMIKEIVPNNKIIRITIFFNIKLLYDVIILDKTKT